MIYQEIYKKYEHRYLKTNLTFLNTFASVCMNTYALFNMSLYQVIIHFLCYKWKKYIIELLILLTKFNVNLKLEVIMKLAITQNTIMCTSAQNNTQELLLKDIIQILNIKMNIHSIITYAHEGKTLKYFIMEFLSFFLFFLVNSIFSYIFSFFALNDWWFENNSAA